MPDPTPLPAPEPTPPSSSTPPSSTPPSSTPPTSLAPDHHLEALATAAQALADDGASAGLGARVPTCPRWRVADLIAHQGMVHRWATATLRREEVRTPSKTEILRTVPRAGLLAWFTDGAAALLATFADTPPDADAMVFLNDAPAPRAFWARRQAHETTIHAVDALAARLGRPPEADEVAIPTDLALDGIDELLRGFFTRGRSRLATDRPFTIAVLPDDDAVGWLLHVGPDRLTTDRLTTDDRATTDRSTTKRAANDQRRDDAAERADVVFAGTAAQLYLGLWNRGEQIRASGRPELLRRWHEVQRVTWS